MTRIVGFNSNFILQMFFQLVALVAIIGIVGLIVVTLLLIIKVLKKKAKLLDMEIQEKENSSEDV